MKNKGKRRCHWQMTLLSGWIWIAFPASLAALPPSRIITLSGALSETVTALGLGGRIVATDVTSIYPEAVRKLPKVSNTRQLSVESLLSFAPDLVLAPESDITGAVRYQLKVAGIRLVTFRQEYSARGAARLIREVGEALSIPEKGRQLAEQTEGKVNAAISRVRQEGRSPVKVLFIYARGAGTMTVAGRGSSLDAIISLAGARNSVREFTDFKPYNTEMLVKSNPDVVLMFDFGMSSLGGARGVKDLPGMSGTQAGMKNRIIAMDGQLLTDFSVRLPDAILALHQKLYPERKDK